MFFILPVFSSIKLMSFSLAVMCIIIDLLFGLICRPSVHVQAVQSSARRLADNVRMHQYVLARAGSGSGDRRGNRHQCHRLCTGIHTLFCDWLSPNSTWLVTSRRDTTRSTCRVS